MRDDLRMKTDPYSLFQQAFQSWSQAHDQQVDPLAASLVVNPGSGIDHVASLNNTINPRAGRAFQTFDLGGGQMAHVYYDARGKRQVFKFQKPAAA